MARLGKTSLMLVAVGSFWAYTTPAFADPDYDGYQRCFDSCSAAFPDRIQDCNVSCRQSNGFPEDDDGSNDQTPCKHCIFPE